MRPSRWLLLGACAVTGGAAAVLLATPLEMDRPGQLTSITSSSNAVEEMHRRYDSANGVSGRPVGGAGSPLDEGVPDGDRRKVGVELHRDSRSPLYDAVVLLDLGVAAQDVFEEELRDEAWAPGREQWLQDLLHCELAESMPSGGARDAEIERVECRTASCVIEVSTEHDVAALRGRFFFRLGLAEAIAGPLALTAEGNRQRFAFYLTYSPGQRDHETFRRLYGEMREKRLASGLSEGSARCLPF